MFRGVSLGRPYLHALIILAVGVLCYANSFSVPFQFDDNAYIIDNPAVYDFGYFLDLDRAKGHALYHYLLNRYVGMLSLYLNYQVGGLSTAGYHAFNLAVHLASALMLYLLVVLTFKTPALLNRGVRLSRDAGSFAALIAALLFVAHPIQTQAVTYISQRFTSMAAFFYICSVASYAGMRLSDGRRSRALLYAVSLLSALIGMRTKEICMTLPVLLLAYEWMFFEDTPSGRIKRLLPHLLTILIVPATVLYVNRPAGEIFGEVATSSRADTDVARLDYLLTQFVVIVKYLGLVLVPAGQNLDHDQPLYTSPWNLDVAGAASVLAAIAGFGLYLYRRKPEHRMVAFGIAWFFVALSVESSVIPIRDLMFEHRMYLPMAGLALAAGSGAVVWAGDIRGRSRVLTVMVPMVVLALALSTTARNAVWSSELSLWRDASAKSPGKARPLLNYGFELYRLGRLDEAERVYETVLRIDPAMPEALLDYGLLLFDTGRLAQAEAEYMRALAAKPGYTQALFNLGVLYLATDRAAKALVIYQDLVALYPAEARYQKNLGVALFQTDRTVEAREALEKALRLSPDDPDIYFNIGFLAGREGRIDDAIVAFQESLRLNPEDSRTRQMLDTLKAVRAERAGRDVFK